MENNGYGFEYVMSETLAKELLKDRKGDEKKMDNQKYLIKIVNEQFGIMGTCFKVSTTL